MKTIVSCFAACTLLSAMAAAQPPRYAIVDLAVVNGSTYSAGNAIGNYPVIGGVESLPDGTQHAALWYPNLGLKLDLGKGVPGGLNSSVYGVNDRGEVLISSEIPAKDPNNENFCGYGSGLQCRAFQWRGGALIQLPTLGGNNATVGDNVNNRGEMPGIAETAVRDKQCPAGVLSNGTGPQLFDYEAVIWGPGAGDIRKLSPLPGDTVGMAFWINDNGQAAGASGSCTNSLLPPFTFGAHAVLWEKDGSVTDLGNLGGKIDPAAPLVPGLGNIAFAVNNAGQATGASLVGDPATSVHSFLWTPGAGIKDLGTLPGDAMSAGLGMNDGGTVVGGSTDADGNPRAFVWSAGAMRDLNDISHGAPLFLLTAFAVNTVGEIVGFGATAKGDVHAFLAIPETGPAARALPGPIALSAEARAALRRYSAGRPEYWIAQPRRLARND
jgi:probable HAF family extracellular repeat protein